MQHKRGEILAWKVYLLCNWGLILDKPVLIACIPDSPRLFAAACEKFPYKIRMRFLEFFFLTYEMSLNCINWITAKIYAEILAESLQVI